MILCSKTIEACHSIAGEIAGYYRLIDTRYPYIDNRLNAKIAKISEKLWGLLIEEGNRVEWKPAQNLVNAVKNLNRWCFISGMPKSGTTVFTYLMDAHENLNVLTGDSAKKAMLYQLSSFMEYDEENICGIPVKHIGRYIWKNVKKNETFFGNLSSRFEDHISFIKYMEFFGTISNEPALSIVAKSYWAANPKRVKCPTYHVAKNPGLEFYFEDILSLIPESKLIHIIRDPREHLVSLRASIVRHDLKSAYWNIEAASDAIYRSSKKALDLQRKYGKERILIIRYEELETPQECMEKIVSFLGIGFKDSLMQVTCNGYPTKSNSMFDREYEGIKVARNYNWKRPFSRVERAIATAFLMRKYRTFGYEWELSTTSYLIAHLILIFIRIIDNISKLYVENNEIVH